MLHQPCITEKKQHFPYFTSVTHYTLFADNDETEEMTKLVHNTNSVKKVISSVS